MKVKPIYYEDPPHCDVCGDEGKYRNVKTRVTICGAHSLGRVQITDANWREIHQI